METLRSTSWTQIGQEMGFTERDVALNRDGELSRGQRKRAEMATKLDAGAICGTAISGGLFVGFVTARKPAVGYDVANGVLFAVGTALVLAVVSWFVLSRSRHAALGNRSVKSVTGKLKVKKQRDSVRLVVGNGVRSRQTLVPAFDIGVLPVGEKVTLYYLKVGQCYFQSLAPAT